MAEEPPEPRYGGKFAAKSGITQDDMDAAGEAAEVKMEATKKPLPPPTLHEVHKSVVANPDNFEPEEEARYGAQRVNDFCERATLSAAAYACRWRVHWQEDERRRHEGPDRRGLPPDLPRALGQVQGVRGANRGKGATPRSPWRHRTLRCPATLPPPAHDISAPATPFLVPRAQGEGECSAWMMDYLGCIDKCSQKLLFKALV